MKVLFAVNNEKISESVIKKYQAKYKEIISVKNVYYFNAIIKELQRDKSYDRVVISEDLEPFSNKSYDMMDKFLFEKLDSISDEASNSAEGEIPIVLICTDRREKSDPMLTRIFSIGIYSALIGQDRTIDNLCDLINKPRSKKDAKVYYRIDADDAEYKSEKAESIPEVEMENILKHYKKIGKDEEKIVESFNNIVSQYSKEQLKVIANMLPLVAKAVLEEKSPKYQEVMIGSVKNKINEKEQRSITAQNINTMKRSSKIDLIEKQINKNTLTKPVVIPSTVNIANVKKVYKEIPVEPVIEEKEPVENNLVDDIYEQPAKTEVKRGRGRPPKVKMSEENLSVLAEPTVTGVKRGRGRPPKIKQEEQVVEENNINMLPGFDSEEYEEDKLLSSFDNNTETILPGIENDYEDNNSEQSEMLPGFEDDEIDLSQINSENTNNQTNQKNYNNPIDEDNYVDKQYGKVQSTFSSSANETRMQAMQIDETPNNLPNLLTASKKIVAFVGTSKNGTSFLVNNLAELLSNKGIKTAVLDLTKNKNAYYIYTQNDESLRNDASVCIDNLRSGIAKGIEVHKNLTVYTTSPNEDTGVEDYASILETLVINNSLVLLDCDFSTDLNYFKETQEIYIVQSYDILTIQPLTAFLRELKDRNILPQNKLRIVINKALRVKELNEKIIIGGISSYNDPTMSYMKELFDRDTVIYTTVPFEDQTYSKYLEGLVNCEISLKGYSKGLLESLNKLGNMVYPLISNNVNNQVNYNNVKGYNAYNAKNNSNAQFGGNIEDTLSRMRKNY